MHMSCRRRKDAELRRVEEGKKEGRKEGRKAGRKEGKELEITLTFVDNYYKFIKTQIENLLLSVSEENHFFLWD